MAKRVVICGSTGSIGEQALDVIAGSDELELVGLSAATNWERLVAQAREHGRRRPSRSPTRRPPSAPAASSTAPASSPATRGCAS